MEMTAEVPMPPSSTKQHIGDEILNAPMSNEEREVAAIDTPIRVIA